MEPTKIIFLLGCSLSGKDTIGKMLVSKGYTRVSFADAVKQEYAEQNNLNVEVLHKQGPEKEKHRSGMIELAESKRAIDPLCWLKKAFEPFLDEKGEFKEGLKLVITDCRRSSEIEWIQIQKQHIYDLNTSINDPTIKHYLDFKLIHVKRPNTIDPDVLTHYTIGYAYGLSHANLPFSIVDASINNDLDVKALEAKVNLCMEEFDL